MTTSTKTTRLQNLKRHVERLDRYHQQLQSRSNRYSWLRLWIVVVGLLLAGIAFYGVGAWGGGSVFMVMISLFAVAVYYHQQVDQTARQFAATRQLKQTHIARMTLDWPNIPRLSQQTIPPEHPFAPDLDIVGEQSLSHLIDTTVSREGSDRLIHWLTETSPNLETIQQRQQLAQELIPRFLFRDRLIINAVVASGSRKMWGAKGMMQWLQTPFSISELQIWLWGAWGLALLNGLLFLLHYIGWIPPFWQFSFIFYLVLLMSRVTMVGQLINEAVRLQETLKQSGAVFQQLERFSYRQTPHLQALAQPFQQPTERPSRYLRHLTRLVFAAGLRGNPVTWFLLNALIPWDLLVAYQLGRQKQVMADHAPPWFEAWFELEAVSALANLAYLNPHYSLPTVTTGEVVFQTSQLGHPLIPDEQKVSNDFQVNQLGEVVMITGSNMAGKSTFMRTVGLNMALAYAGGPVSAGSMQVGLFRLFTCIKVSDSVTSGFSYFYAEVRRLKQLLTALETSEGWPLFYFIDEIFRGTNNRERLIGSRAYVAHLTGQSGVGFISTHDLELAKLASHNPLITNYHFRDNVVDNQMIFDYCIHFGPCPTTNALKLMALEGLPVEATL